MSKAVPPNPEALLHMLTRRSVPRLQDPAPCEDVLNKILSAALRSPDHMHLRPWRFLKISGNNRFHLGNLFVKHEKCRNRDAKQELLEHTKKKALRAPLIIVGISSYKEHPKVPKIEQSVSTGGVINNIGLAAYFSGFATIWRTGTYAYSDVVKNGLGVAEKEDIIGFLYIGTPSTQDIRPLEVPLGNYIAPWPN
ncbi:MAG: hypothetical protein CBC09_06865 [Cellvibrionales bacterium TMED49]|nr:nitroreductase [Porticoccaceae bacterium]OUU37346.1 MAG: hypothetical protein CBC09_06865 [Cellvibrionales bacterium TMED49]